MISIGADGRIQRVNRALPRSSRRSRSRARTRLEDLFSREDTAEIRYLMKRARRTGTAPASWNCARDDQKLHLAVTVSALEEKLTSGFVVVLEDTSELLRAQKAAAWHEVARRVAHEIKNPLTPDRAFGRAHRAASWTASTLPPDTARILHECAATISQVGGIGEDAGRRVLAVRALPRRAAGALRSERGGREALLVVFDGRLDGIAMHDELRARTCRR